MKKKSIVYLVIALLVVCCSSLAFAQAPPPIDDNAAWMYHPEKDKNFGAYEWWYMDIHLDNGYLLAIMFGVPNQFLAPYNKYLDNHLPDVLKGIPDPSFDPKNFAAVEFSVTDEKGKVLFDGYEDVKPQDMHLPTLKNMVVKFNNSQIKMKKNGDKATYTFKMDLKDKEGKNTAKANLVLNSQVPTVAITQNQTADGKPASDGWVIMTANAKVKAAIAITNKETGKTTKIKERGLGYHDKNWGTHPMRAVLKGWIWTRIAEPDLAIVFTEVPIISGAFIKSCIVFYKGKILATTDAMDIVKGPVGNFRLPYPTETTVKFKPESGIKGTLKYHDLKLVNAYPGTAYSRWRGKYSLDIESKAGKLKRDGDVLFEYTDFTVK